MSIFRTTNKTIALVATAGLLSPISASQLSKAAQSLLEGYLSPQKNRTQVTQNIGNQYTNSATQLMQQKVATDIQLRKEQIKEIIYGPNGIIADFYGETLDKANVQVANLITDLQNHQKKAQQLTKLQAMLQNATAPDIQFLVDNQNNEQLALQEACEKRNNQLIKETIIQVLTKCRLGEGVAKKLDETITKYAEGTVVEAKDFKGRLANEGNILKIKDAINNKYGEKLGEETYYKILAEQVQANRAMQEAFKIEPQQLNAPTEITIDDKEI